MKKIYLLAFTLLISGTVAMAQDDIMAELAAETPKMPEKTTATFKTTRVILSHSTEMYRKGDMDFRVAHRFTDVAGADGGYNTFFGFDNSADIRIGFEFGVAKNTNIGVARNKMGKTIDGYFKYKILSQTTENESPVSVVYMVSTAMTGINKEADVALTNFNNRLSYVHQLLVSRKFSRNLSLQVMPTYMHRNYVSNTNKLDKNDIISIGFTGRVKLTKRFGLVGDYYYIMDDYRVKKNNFYNPLGLGIEIETGGHVFGINFANSGGIIANNFLATTQSSWLKGGFKYGFEIARIFKVYTPKVPSN